AGAESAGRHREPRTRRHVDPKLDEPRVGIESDMVETAARRMGGAARAFDDSFGNDAGGRKGYGAPEPARGPVADADAQHRAPPRVSVQHPRFPLVSGRAPCRSPRRVSPNAPAARARVANHVGRRSIAVLQRTVAPLWRGRAAAEVWRVSRGSDGAVGVAEY